MKFNSIWWWLTDSENHSGAVKFEETEGFRVDNQNVSKGSSSPLCQLSSKIYQQTQDRKVHSIAGKSSNQERGIYKSSITVRQQLERIINFIATGFPATGERIQDHDTGPQSSRTKPR